MGSIHPGAFADSPVLLPGDDAEAAPLWLRRRRNSGPSHDDCDDGGAPGGCEGCGSCSGATTRARRRGGICVSELGGDCRPAEESISRGWPGGLPSHGRCGMAVLFCTPLPGRPGWFAHSDPQTSTCRITARFSKFTANVRSSLPRLGPGARHLFGSTYGQASIEKQDLDPPVHRHLHGRVIVLLKLFR